MQPLVIPLEHDYFCCETASFLIDTGSQLNLVKRQGLTSDLQINSDIVYDLTGIGSGMIRTQGEVEVFIYDVPVHFQVVDNDFPIKETGILGLSFLKKQEITLKFRDTLPDSLQFGKGETLSCASSSHDLPPRTKVLITVPTNSSNASGYVRRIDAGPGIFVGEALVSQENGFNKIICHKHHCRSCCSHHTFNRVGGI